MESVPLTFPARINRYLAHKGFSTRRGADELITQGFVKINGKIAKLGDKVTETDVVEVSENVLAKNALRHRYVAYHKPRGVSTDVQHDSKSISSELPALRGLFPLGRLDKDSHGLIILTNDGRLTERLLHPSRNHEKEYHVRVNKPVTDTFIRHLERGILIETYKTKPAKARRSGETLFNITLTEGKKHQIRRMCTAEGYNVEELTRIRIMNVKLDDLKEGAYRNIEGEELLTFLKTIGL
ncbi:MAG: pseudouridine synthase [Candidatus Pacebacteria bacterium]|nr:pseudouridine synthase [Candidatus Paceibacterota bacterium]